MYKQISLFVVISLKRQGHNIERFTFSSVYFSQARAIRGVRSVGVGLKNLGRTQSSAAGNKRVAHVFLER